MMLASKTSEQIQGETHDESPDETPGETHDESPNKTLGENIRAKPLTLVVACALIDLDNRVLLAKRPPNKEMSGYWEFPGGKVEKGETPEKALLRELQEELGIITEKSCLAPLSFSSHPYDKFHLLMPLYICRVWQGIVTPLEAQEIKWVKPNKLSEMLALPADRFLIAMLQDLL